ncbi:AAA family ATPase [Polyangium mundeleinium]|uniref:AAA family ATPase n=1 Tax=Polyangium mundeleinium TaxID=2995306 RepID=A0ABT5F6D0_9BACT|nr:AAA family ATPase [Polyangium mundeleinium]MDC0748692.1 AAA family ATPase [Polyangium mundeleinium]
MNAPLRVPLGIDDFQKVREGGLLYVDKTHLVTDLLEKAGAEVVLLPRPRRFGKSLNLSMVRCFFEKRAEDLSPLFRDLRVWQAGDAVRAHFQRYPVIHLTMKGAKQATFEACWKTIREKIEALFREHKALLTSGALDAREEEKYRAILDGTADDVLYGRALLDLCHYLHRAHGERVLLLIDEYDEPIHAGYTHGYAPRILDFCRAFYGEGLKGNPHLFRAVLTGILRVARESIFSGLNNVTVYSLLRSEFNTCFGFTEPEVERLLTAAGRTDRLETLRAWYNGYLFGGEVIYNPWSVLNFLAAEDKDPEPYWLSTSSNDLIRELLQERAVELEPLFEALLTGDSVEKVLDEHVPLGELRTSENALWSLLVFAGYLKAERHSRGPMERPMHRLSIPNREVRELYTSTFRGWMAARLGGRGGALDALLDALLRGDAERLERLLQAFVTNVLSHHDVGFFGPERVYQAFIVGLLATLEPDYQVRSDRESGHGRADVLVRPARPGKPGVVLELKVVKAARRAPEKALAEGLAQIREKEYAAELRAAGAEPVHAFAAAFDGKRVWVRAATLSPEEPSPRKKARKR